MRAVVPSQKRLTSRSEMSWGPTVAAAGGAGSLMIKLTCHDGPRSGSHPAVVRGRADWSAEVVPAIRSRDPDGVIILGSRQWSQRVDEAPANPVIGMNL